jgi:pimeloyl-ACP methyl ester carboxylesterase
VTWIEKRRSPVAGGEMAFVDAGDPESPAVVLLSGGFTSSYVWRRLVPLLSPWMRVIAPDLLSSGDSTAEPGADLGLEGHAGSVRELLGALGIERFALAGHGHGGGVAQLLALGGSSEALALVDSIAFDAWPEPAVRDLQARGDAIDPAAVERWMRDLIEIGMVRERLAEDDVQEYLRPFRGEAGRDRFLRVASSLDGDGLVGLEPRRASLEIPALVLWGEEDALLDAGLAERLGDALPQASVALLPGCGHLLLEDAPETVAPLMFQWLRSRYLKIEHRHEEGPVAVYLGRRPPGEGG